MKYSLFTWALFGLVQLASAAPSSDIFKRQSNEAANSGFATLNGGTTGGIGGTTVTVTTLAALTAAAAGDAKAIIFISGTITGNAVVNIGSNKSILGRNSGASLVGIGLRVNKKNNVIIRNIKVSKVLASTGDAIGIQEAKNVWVDHVELFSDMTHDKDYYDGLLDITHGCDWITVSHCYLHDHWKGSLVGHSDNNSGEDIGHLTVTYKHNYWKNLNSRAPSFRYGTGHVFNNYFESVADGINTRLGAQLLVQNNVFSGCKKPLYSTDGGFATATGNDFGGVANAAPAGQINSVPYSYTLGGISTLKAYVIANAGNILTLG